MNAWPWARRIVATIVLIVCAAITLANLLAIRRYERDAGAAGMLVGQLGETVAAINAADNQLRKLGSSRTEADVLAYRDLLETADQEIVALSDLVGHDPRLSEAMVRMKGVSRRRRNAVETPIRRWNRLSTEERRALVLDLASQPAFPVRNAVQVITTRVRQRMEQEVSRRQAAVRQAFWATGFGLLATGLLLSSAIAAVRRESTLRAAAERERMRLATDLEAARLQIESANTAREQFLGALGHELRTPLTPVLMAVTSALDNDGSADRSTLEMIRRNIHLETRLIDDLFDLSRLNHVGLTLDLAPVDVHWAIRRALEVCRHEVRRTGLRVVLDLTAASHEVRAHESRLLQVFWNLVQNAGRYTPAGGSLVIHSRNERGMPADLFDPARVAASRLVIEFRDTGQGIAPEFLAKVFDPFQQATAPGTRRSFGLGLGLTICRGIVEGLGGRLTASSPGVGQGTTFRVELPLAQASAALDDPMPLAAPGAMRRTVIDAATTADSERQLRILLVDDEPDTARFLAHVLGSQGHEVVVASSLAAARASIAVTPAPFDLLISDLELPDGTSLDLMRERNGTVPAIALSGHGADEDRAETRRAGFQAHLTKPVEASQLRALVAQVARGEPIAGA